MCFVESNLQNGALLLGTYWLFSSQDAIKRRFN